MTPERLRAIQEALLREFPSDCTTANCPLGQRGDIVYSHVPAAVDATSLYPLVQTDIDERANGWVWPTATAYEQGTHHKPTVPYRDFIASRFVWKELAGVRIGGLANTAAPTVTTAADGGAVIVWQQGHEPAQGAQATITAPAQTAVAGYPTVRRVCLSVPGQAGNHAELADNVSECSLGYAQPTTRGQLRLLSVMPWFSFELRSGDGGGVEAITGDLWRERIGYGATLAARWRKWLWETSTNTQIGQIVRYAKVHFGIQNMGADGAATIRSNYAGTLSASRRMVIAGVLGVEGGPNAIATHDGPKISWGMNQWVMPANTTTGELAQILAYIYDFFPAAFDRCFGRYGLGITFTGRNRTWTRETYRGVGVFRIPCCGPGAAPVNPSVRAALDSMRTTLGTPGAATGLHAALAQGFRLLTRTDTISVAMIYLFYKAGLDADVQRAQVEWTSYRISSAIRSHTNPSNDAAIAAFLVSLGSNIDATTRQTKAAASIAAGRGEGHTYPNFTDRFDDTGTAEAWRDWATRCDDAGKETTPPKPAARRQT